MSRKIIVEFIVPREFEEDYDDVCPELIISDFLKTELKILFDSKNPSNYTELPFTNICDGNCNGCNGCK